MLDTESFPLKFLNNNYKIKPWSDKTSLMFCFFCRIRRQHQKLTHYYRKITMKWRQWLIMNRKLQKMTSRGLNKYTKWKKNMKVCRILKESKKSSTWTFLGMVSTWTWSWVWACITSPSQTLNWWLRSSCPILVSIISGKRNRYRSKECYWKAMSLLRSIFQQSDLFP